MIVDCPKPVVQRSLRGLAVAAGLAVALQQVVAAPSAALPPQQDGPTFDSSFDGVWIGSVQVRNDEAEATYPLSLNLDADGTNVHGVALMPDDLGGGTSAWAFFPVRGIAKAARLTLEIASTPLPAAAEAAREPLRLTLKLRKGVLSGTVNAADLRRGEVELRQPSAELPLQQTWVEELPSIRSSGPLALAIFQDSVGGDANAILGGVGSLGTESGPLSDGTFDGTRMQATLQLASGPVAVDFELKSGRLRGGIVGADEVVELYAGGVRNLPVVTALDPEGVAAGRPSVVTVRGKHLAPGFLVHFATTDVRPGVPAVIDEQSAEVIVDAPAEAVVGSRVEAFTVAADGVPRAIDDDLAIDAAQPVSFRADLLPVFRASCAVSGCHVTPAPDPDFGIVSPPGDLILEDGAAYTNLVDRQSAERPDLMRVLPGDPDASYLILKLRGSPGIVGERMPRNGPYLSEATIAAFVAWIRDGAPRN